MEQCPDCGFNYHETEASTGTIIHYLYWGRLAPAAVTRIHCGERIAGVRPRRTITDLPKNWIVV